MNNHIKTAALSFGNGRYEVVEQIGEGGMAFVYRVRDTKFNGVERALKVLKSRMSQSREIKSRFLAEAQIMAQVEDPGIVRVFDFGEETDGQVWLVMELVDGGSLVDRLKHGKLSPRQTVDIGIAVLSALMVVHEKGIVHRDIKSHNILWTKRSRILVADFGIAHVEERNKNGLTQVGTKMGTWDFMSPEQRADASSVDARADLYAVAAILFDCLLNKGSVPDLFTEGLGKTSLLVGIPEVLAEVIKKATCFNREDRYSSAEEMIKALKKARVLLPAESNVSPLILPVGKKPTIRFDPSELLKAENRFGLTAVPIDDEAEAEVAEEPEEAEESVEEVEEEPIDQSPSQHSWFRVVFAVVMLVVILVGGVWWFNHQKEKPVEVSTVPTIIETIQPEAEVKSTQPIVVPQPEEKKVSSVTRPKPTVSVETPKVAEVVPVTTTPVLQHQSPTIWPAGKAFTPEVKITSGQYRVKVYFRLLGNKAYDSFPMTEKDSVWRVSIPVDSGTSGFEYHVSAESKDSSSPKLSSGSGFKPHSVKIK